MKCSYCGYETAEKYPFCPGCGAPYQEETPADSSIVSPEPAPESPVQAPTRSVTKQVLLALLDTRFLVLCILITVYSGICFIYGFIQIFHVLAAIFLWLVYHNARYNTTSVPHLRHLSGVVYAYFITVMVVFSIALVCGFVCIAFAPTIASFDINALLSDSRLNMNFEVNLPPEILEQISAELPDDFWSGLTPAVISTFLVASGFGMIILAAVCGVLAFFSTRSIHRFAQSVYISVAKKQPLFRAVSPAKNWLMVLGIFQGISALSTLTVDFLLGLAEGSLAAALILGSLLIQDWFPNS